MELSPEFSSPQLNIAYQHILANCYGFKLFSVKKHTVYYLSSTKQHTDTVSNEVKDLEVKDADISLRSQKTEKTNITPNKYYCCCVTGCQCKQATVCQHISTL